MKKSIVIGGICVAAFGVLVAVRTFAPKPKEQEAPVPVVETAVLQPGTIELYRDLVGTVEPSDVVYIYPKAAGEITGVFVKAGDMVKEGQAICTIDTKQVEASRLTMEAAKTGLENARNNYNRQKALYDAGDVAPAAFEGVETQYKSAQIQYDQAKLAYNYQMEFSNVTATIDGVVEKCDIEVHDNVASSVLLCVISGEGSRSVTFSVPEKIVKQLHVGDVITLEKSGSEYKGTVNEIASMIDASSGLFKIKASVENGDALATGSSVKLYVTSDKAENVDTLPVDAVYYSGGEAYVYTFDNGTVHYKPIEVGIYDSDRIQILSGLNAGEEVITTWSSELAEGASVQKKGEAAQVENSQEETTKAE